MLVVAQPLAAQRQGDAIARRVDSLVARLTLEEKVGQMTQLTIGAVARGPARAGAAFPLDSVKLEEALVRRHVGALLNTDAAMTPAQWREVIAMVQRFASRGRVPIPVLYGIDAVHGQHYQTTSTIFPQNIALAATFDRELVRMTNRITAYETRASGIPWNFSPVLDLGRQPLWPRFYETFGEDSHLASALGVEATLGNQEDPRRALSRLLGHPAGGDGIAGRVFVAATAKHFLGYSMPLSGKDRTTAWIPDRQLREEFLPSFRASIAAGIRSVMVNSGDINGVPVHASHEILTDLLRTELGFTGIVDSDWADIVRLYSVHRVAENNRDAVRMAVLAGIDMSMVPHDYSFTDDLVSLVRGGEVPMSRIDDAVRRILRVKAELGLFEHALADTVMMANIGAPAFQGVSRRAADEAVTLLRNDADLLPLSPSARILVTGPAARSLPAQFGGWSYTWQGADTTLHPAGTRTLLDAVRARGGDRITYVPGTTFSAEVDIAAAVAAARRADVAVVAIGEESYAETPGNIDDLRLPEAQLRLAREIEATGTPVVVVLLHGRPRVVHDAVENARAVITGYQSGPYAGESLAAALYGELNPGGRLPFSWPRSTGAILIPYDRARAADIGGTDSTVRGYDPEWAFGHGLSYTTFRYSDVTLASHSLAMADTVVAAVTVTNAGTRGGRESVLLYVRDLVASVSPPMRRLRAFDAVSLAPGESRTITFRVPVSELAFVGRNDKLVVEPGDFDLMVGPFTTRFRVH
ncbi:MAG: bglX 4 [Gemmatimonadetes bacterium]|nr:bglX 4 [Gemmatimonadota bacterium]